jgi:hypothetical protein
MEVGTGGRLKGSALAGARYLCSMSAQPDLPILADRTGTWRWVVGRIADFRERIRPMADRSSARTQPPARWLRKPAPAHSVGFSCPNKSPRAPRKRQKLKVKSALGRPVRRGCARQKLRRAWSWISVHPSNSRPSKLGNRKGEGECPCVAVVGRRKSAPAHVVLAPSRRHGHPVGAKRVLAAQGRSVVRLPNARGPAPSR